DCFSGISGDMTLGALIDCGADRALLDAAVESLRLGNEVTVEVRHETRGHAGGTRVVVEVHDRVERTVPALRRVVEDADMPDPLVDVVGAFWLLHALDVTHVYASPLPASRGLKDGMPLPAPASLRVLEGTGAVLQPSDETRELVTPTGAAILAAVATFERPTM